MTKNKYDVAHLLLNHTPILNKFAIWNSIMHKSILFKEMFRIFLIHVIQN